MTDTDLLDALRDDVSRLQAGHNPVDVLTVLRDGEERDVAVLFLDLKGFTAMSEKLDSEMVQLIIDHCFKVFSEDIIDNGGLIEKYMGDAIMATFGAHDDTPAPDERAVRAGVLMLERLKHINGTIGDLGLEIGLRIGVNHGPAVAGRIGLQRDRDFTLLGDTVTVGLYLEPYAPVNSLMIRTEVRDALGDRFIYKDLDPCHMEEIDRTLDVCNVLGITGVDDPIPDMNWLLPLQRDVDRIARKEGDAASAIMNLRGGERRNVAILFLVLKGVTGDGSLPDSLQLQVAFDHCLKMFSPDVTMFGGEVEKYMGDSVLMATFGAHSSYENDAERSVRAAVAILSRVEGINRELEPLGFQIKVQAGINYGLVTTGRVGLGRDRDFTVMGDTVNTAQRLEANAPANSLMIRRELKDALGDLFTYEDLPPITVKGKTEPLDVCTVAGATSQRKERWERDLLTNRAEFVGRDDDLRTLDDAWRSCTDPARPQSVVVRIEASGGNGKSRLIHEFLSTHPGTQMHLHGNTESVIQAPYQLFADLLSRTLNLDGEDPQTFRERLLAFDAGLDEGAPYLASILGIPLETERLEAMDPQARQLETQLALASFIRAAARNVAVVAGPETPLVIVLDDLHWIDPSSVKALEFLLNRLGDTDRQFWLLLGRPGSPLPESLPHQGVLLHLEPLSAEAMRSMIESMLPGLELKETDWELLHSKTSGTPFFVEELVNTLVKARVIIDNGDRWILDRELDAAQMPDSVGGLVKARIDKLKERGREMLSQGAVIGTDVPTDCLVHINSFLGKSVTDIHEHERKIAKRDLIIVPDDDHFIFKSQIVQEVAYEGLLLRNRSLLHRLVAEYLESQGVGNALNEAPLMFHHYSKTEDYEKLFHYLDQAIDLALQNYDLQSALKICSQGIALLDEMEDNEANRVRRYDVLSRRVSVHNLLGNREEQAADIDWTLDHARSTGDPNLMGECLLNLAEMHVMTTTYDKALEALSQVEDAFAPLTDELKERYHRYRGLVFSKQGRFDESLAAYGAALEIDERLGQSKTLASIHLNIGLLHTERSQFKEALEHYERALEYNADANDRRNRGMILNNIGIVRKNNGHYSDALATYKEVYEIFETIGDKNYMAFSLGNIGITQRLLGLYQEALNSMELARFFFEEVKNPVAAAMSRQQLGAILTEIDETDKALVHLEAALETGREIGFKPMVMDSLLYRSQLEIRQGRPEAALNTTREGLEIARESQDHKRELSLMTMNAQALLMSGHPNEATDQAMEALTILAEMPSSEEAERVHYVLHLVLKDLMPKASQDSLDIAWQIVTDVADTLNDEDRVRYLNKPINRAIREPEAYSA